MSSQRRGVLIAAAVAALAAALPAAAKEEVKATLTTHIRLDATPGSKLRVSWQLFRVDRDSERQPFGAGDLFVRLQSISGAAAREAFATTSDGTAGEFSAVVVVPEGGIGDIEIGLRGWRSDANGTKRADVLFPITNDPLPGPAKAAGPTLGGGGEETGGSPPWLVLAAAAAAPAVLAAVIMLARGRRSRGPRPAPNSS